MLQQADLHPRAAAALIAYSSSLDQVWCTADARAGAERLRPDPLLRADDDAYPMVIWPMGCLHAGYGRDEVRG